jgi:hypothetical protein
MIFEGACKLQKLFSAQSDGMGMNGGQERSEKKMPISSRITEYNFKTPQSGQVISSSGKYCRNVQLCIVFNVDSPRA